jgi:hypothetical protein
MTLLDHSRGPRLRRALVGLSAVTAIVAGVMGAGGGTIARIGFMLYAPTTSAGAQSSNASAPQAVSAPTFFPNVKMPCLTEVAGPAACLGLLEPEVTSAPDGTIYVTAQEGVPGGVNLWRREPGSSEYVHINKPDANEPLTSATGFALGGGDNDLAVTTDGRVLVATLSLVSAPVSYSTDRGETFTKVELANGLLNVDRMWLTTIGKSTVYYAYHDNELSQIWLVKSTDGGETWSVPVPVIPAEMLPQSAGLLVTAGNIQGDIVTDPDGRLYMPFLSSKAVEGNVPLGKPNAYYVAITDTNGENPTIHTVYEGDEDIQGLFPAIASDLAGNIYATWTNKHTVFLAISRDHGETWSAPQKISTGKGNTSTVFPYVIAGSKGRVALAWLGSDAETNDVTEAKWKTYFAQSTDALKKDATWTQVVASDHIVHTGSICLEGLACDVTGGNRSLAEVLQMGLTKDGRVIISYPGTSSADLSGWAYVAEQRLGPGLYADIVPNPPALIPKVRKPGGIIEGLVRRLGTMSNFFVGGDAGTGLPDADGNEVDSIGDVGKLSTTQGSEGHVASANVYTTAIGGIPLAFEGDPFTSTKIVGGNLTVTAFIESALYEVANASGELPTINIRLFDVDAEGARKEIVAGSTNYVSGIDATKQTYTFKIAKPWEVLKGHHLRAELFFTIWTSSDARFLYGDAVHPSGFTVDTFALTGSGNVAPVVPKPKPRVLPSRLPATGVGSSYLLAILALGGALVVGRSLIKRRG